MDLKKETKLIATDTINSTIMSIQIGFTLATALAFNEYIKKLLASSLIPERPPRPGAPPAKGGARDGETLFS